ncbi:hypothetical protein BH09SUM1_BH09SUM1_21140 [soil metagenome]
MRLNDLLRETAEEQASDLYIAAGAVPCMNCEGVYTSLKQAQGQRVSAEDTMAFAKQAMNDRQWKDFEETLEANLAYMSAETGRFRVNVFWQRGSIAMVCRRVIMNIPTLRSLGLPPVLREIAIADRGIVLVTGSTGSGKSTSLASMIDYRNHLHTGHIVTIEDPVEFVYRHRRSVVTQREVGIDTHSFHEALKNTLRQAPQVICIGEMRDADTVQFAMHAAETGHLVFATLHSTNSTLAIERILHFYPGEMEDQIQMQLSLNLKAIICQRLVQKIGGGRVAAIEILINTPRMQDLIAKGDPSALKMALAAENQDGIQTFDKSLYRLCKTGRITQEDALQSAESANDLAMKFKGIGVGGSWLDTSDPWAGIKNDFETPANLPQYQKLMDPNASGFYSNEDAPALRSSAMNLKIQSGVNLEGRKPLQMPPGARPPGPPPLVLPPTPLATGQAGPPRPPQQRPPGAPPPPQNPGGAAPPTPQQGQPTRPPGAPPTAQQLRTPGALQPPQNPQAPPVQPPGQHRIFHTPPPKDKGD